jgi:DNA-binding transcriptional MerR regulator
MDLLTIGAFARQAHLSPKALRLYDELGLLPPAHVDPDTGYRWYAPDQLGRARRVGLLRRLDMPLIRIREVLDLAPAEAARELEAYWGEQERHVVAKRELVAFLVDQLNGKKPVMFDVKIREVPARTLLSVTENLTSTQVGEFAGPLFGLFGGPTVPRPHGVAGRPFLRYHSELTVDSDGQVEFCCPVVPAELEEVAGRFPDMTTSTEPPGREAYISVTMADIDTALGFESLRQWFTDHDERDGGPVRQIFLTDPGAAKSDETVYELAVPLG